MHPNLSHLLDDTPAWLDVFFTATTMLTLGLLFVAIRRLSIRQASLFLGLSLLWLAGLGVLAYNHFFQQLDARPPGFALVLTPPLLLIIGLLTNPKSRAWLYQLLLADLTRLHTVRVPVELTLYGLYMQQQIPQLMTFEGRNYDILAGLTAPLVAHYFVGQKRLARRWLLTWNVLALGLVLNIVVQAILSLPLPFQQLAFEQPNVGLLKWPYVWLPGFVVPVVLFSHIVVIQRLISAQNRNRV
ncbi:hypothetical protein [Spirosoma koreense]